MSGMLPPPNQSRDAARQSQPRAENPTPVTLTLERAETAPDPTPTLPSPARSQLLSTLVQSNSESLPLEADAPPLSFHLS